jgi:hypothetical protein
MVPNSSALIGKLRQAALPVQWLTSDFRMDMAWLRPYQEMTVSFVGNTRLKCYADQIKKDTQGPKSDIIRTNNWAIVGAVL